MGRAHIWTPRGVGIDTDALTATPDDAVAGYTGLFKGSDELQEGTIPVVTQDHTLGVNETWAPPAGFHDGTGKVKQAITNRGAWTGTVGVNLKTTIPEGYHSGSGKVSQSLTTIAGGSYTPTAAGQTLETANKLLTSSIIVPKDANLKSANIATKMWGVAAGFTPLDTAYTLYKDGNYYGWWKDGVVAYAGVQNETKYKNPAPLLSALQTAVNISTADFSGNLGLSDANRGSSSATAASKPQLRITHKLEHDAHADYRYLLGGVIGYKTVDLSLFSTLTVRYTINEMSAVPTYMGGFNYENVYLAVGFAKGPSALTQGGVASAAIDSNNNHIAAGPGSSGAIKNQSGSFIVNVSSYTDHWYIIPLFIIRDYQGATNGNAIYTTDITVDSIILGK